jgi:hypothetical protein
VSSRPLTIAALLLLALATAVSPAVAGQKVTTPLLRVADPSGTARGSVQVKLKGQGSSVTVLVAKIEAGVATPLGVFLEDEPEGGVFTQVAAIELSPKGAGKITLASSDGPPAELGVESLDDLAGRMLEVRDGNGAALLDALLPGLAPFAGTKLVAKLLPPDGAPAPAASATLTGKPTAGKGSERFRLKAKKLPAGAAELFIEDAPGSETFVSAGDQVAGLYLRDTALGDRLPLEVAAHVDLVGCAIEVRDGETVLLAGTIEVKGTPVLTFPLTGVIVLESGPGFVDRYLRVVGDSGPLYRSLTDLSEVTAQELADTDEALWRLDKIGQTANGPLVTVTLVGHDNCWWLSAITGGTHYVHVQKQSADPADFDYAHFVLRMGPDFEGKPSFLIESAYYADEFLLDQGHILTANGVKIGGGGATFVLHKADAP